MDAKETRIAEIMDEISCDYDVAEQIFIDEICDKYQTEDIDVAETMFCADSEDWETQINMNERRIVMNADFIQLSNKVVKNTENELYYSRIDSAKAIKMALTEDESQYEVSAGDVEIQIKGEQETYTDAVLITFCKEENEAYYFVDILISDLLGTFISDWY